MHARSSLEHQSENPPPIIGFIKREEASLTGEPKNPTPTRLPGQKKRWKGCWTHVLDPPQRTLGMVFGKHPSADPRLRPSSPLFVHCDLDAWCWKRLAECTVQRFLTRLLTKSTLFNSRKPQDLHYATPHHTTPKRHHALPDRKWVCKKDRYLSNCCLSLIRTTFRSSSHLMRCRSDRSIL